jgi:hypothetical protein
MALNYQIIKLYKNIFRCAVIEERSQTESNKKV